MIFIASYIYVCLDPLGQGGFGRVYKGVVRPTGAESGAASALAGTRRRRERVVVVKQCAEFGREEAFFNERNCKSYF